MTNDSEPQVRRLPLWKKALFAVLPVVLILLGTEATLWIIGYDSPVADPYESFVLHHPLFVPAEGDWVTTNPGRTHFFHKQTFTKTKPSGTRRICVFGGSTTFGWALPKPRVDGYVAQLGKSLQAEYPGTKFEMINCGGCSYASYRLVDLVEECMQYDPDLVIVMSGHNEFLEARHYADLIGSDSAGAKLWYSLRTVRLVSDLSTRATTSRTVVLGDNPFDSEVYVARDQKEYDWTLKHYERNLSKMVRVCRAHDVPIILCTCPSNLLDSPPFHSEARGNLSPAEYDRLLEEIRELHDQKKDPEGALAVAQRALKKDPRSPYFHYFAGRCYYELERWDEAKESLMRAKETDMFPKRALSSFNEKVRAIAADTGSLLFDAEALYFEEAEHGIPGIANGMFLDDCHPTRRGHRLFAEGLKPLAVQAMDLDD